ncbi:alpha/beta fold hydrolase [Ferrimonas balearica]|uniref:alpha/beta fold hydrolase n=1 Tax=Ferrimonas balearica TaxID=44012 RepID=UPI001C9A13E3|nr:alpha/beta fold hydrolase [Ferrimonas balearica]MBY5993391.1 alpha/beta fold hydrolase [Ferrimonas balearica]
MIEALEAHPLWQQARHGEFPGVDGVTVRYSLLRHPQERGAIALCSGRVESYLKYWELVEQLYAEGYSLYLWDHRGQGRSGRMLEDPQIGHVERFDHYVEDLHHLYQAFIAPAGHRHRFLLGHSMGGAIATEYLARHPGHFQAAALSAPMYGILLPAPKWLLQPLVALMARVRPHGYIPGGGGYHVPTFEENQLTGDRERYQAFRALYHARPKLQLGDPSLRWLSEALKQIDRLARLRVQPPLLVMQAEADTIVDNAAQESFCERQPQHALKRFAGARHELLIERDPIRDDAIRSALAWFDRHGAGR